MKLSTSNVMVHPLVVIVLAWACKSSNYPILKEVNLDVCMSVLGDFHPEKVHVREEMRLSINPLLSDLILTPSMREYVFKTCMVSVFQNILGLVPW